MECVDEVLPEKCQIYRAAISWMTGGRRVESLRLRQRQCRRYSLARGREPQPSESVSYGHGSGAFPGTDDELRQDTERGTGAIFSSPTAIL